MKVGWCIPGISGVANGSDYLAFSDELTTPGLLMIEVSIVDYHPMRSRLKPQNFATARCVAFRHDNAVTNSYYRSTFAGKNVDAFVTSFATIAYCSPKAANKAFLTGDRED
jgi:hypothetical protein